jgi:dolichol-phosphate mannosyltransferase
MERHPVISVIIPVLDEERVLPRLFDRLSVAAARWREPYEIILVDDGSRDRSAEWILGFHERDPRWRAVLLSRSFGQQAAILAGLAHCSGRAAMILDADLQDPPELIAAFLEKWREGYAVVYGRRRSRPESWWLRVVYSAFYRFFRLVADTEIPLDAGDFSLIDRKVIDVLLGLSERRPFLRGLRAWAGFRQTVIAYDRAERGGGSTHYTLGKLTGLALDGIFSFSRAPARLGLALTAGLAAGSAAATIAWLRDPAVFSPWLWCAGWGLTAFGFFGWVIAEYLVRILEEVRRRPSWIVSDTRGFERERVVRLPARTRGGREKRVR